MCRRSLTAWATKRFFRRARLWAVVDAAPIYFGFKVAFLVGVLDGFNGCLAHVCDPIGSLVDRGTANIRVECTVDTEVRSAGRSRNRQKRPGDTAYYLRPPASTINEIDRIVPRISVKVYATVESNRILADPPATPRVIIPCAKGNLGRDFVAAARNSPVAAGSSRRINLEVD